MESSPSPPSPKRGASESIVSGSLSSSINASTMSCLISRSNATSTGSPAIGFDSGAGTGGVDTTHCGARHRGPAPFPRGLLTAEGAAARRDGGGLGPSGPRAGACDRHERGDHGERTDRDEQHAEPRIGFDEPQTAEREAER